MSTSGFLKKLFLSTTFFLVSCLYSDTLSDPINIENPTTYFDTNPFPCYNSDDNNYLLTWCGHNGSNKNVYAAVYDTKGNLVVSAFDPFNKIFNPQCDITTCYNTKSNQYLITWYDFTLGITFAFLDEKANLIKNPLNFTGTATSGNIYCCFNPFTQQYFLSWAANTETNDYPPYYAIINSDGTVFVGPTLINCPTSQAGNGGTVNCCFNSSTQQYLVSWISTTLQRPFFTIINADGRVIKNDIGIQGTGYKSVTATYNSLEKTYFLSWFDINYNTYFCILDGRGNIKKPTTQLENVFFQRNTDLFCSYNSINNTFLLSGVSYSNNLQNQLCLLSSKGEIVYPLTILSSPDGLQFPRTPFSSFGLKEDIFMLTRISSQAEYGSIERAYLQFFTQAPPPSQNSRANKKTCFPSFTPTNPGKNLF